MPWQFKLFNYINNILEDSAPENSNLDEVRRPETAHPKEATLSWSCPHSSNEVENIWFRSHTLKSKNLIIVREISIDYYPKIAV